MGAGVEILGNTYYINCVLQCHVPDLLTLMHQRSCLDLCALPLSFAIPLHVQVCMHAVQ